MNIWLKLLTCVPVVVVWVVLVRQMLNYRERPSDNRSEHFPVDEEDRG